MKQYIKKNWFIPDEQNNSIEFGGGIYTPQLDDSNDLCFQLSNTDFIEMLSSIELGAKIAYPDKYHEISDRFMYGLLSDCNQTGLGHCYRLDTTTEVFSYYPNDPFVDEANANKILSHSKFTRFADLDINSVPIIGDFITNVLGGISGYFDNDIFVTEDVLSPFTNPIERLGDIVSQLTSFPLPYVVVELEGEGQLEVELVNVPAGGSVLMIPDLSLSLQSLWDALVSFIDDSTPLPASWLFTEVNRDIAGLELVATQVQEFEYTVDAMHTMHIIFVPVPKITPPFIHFFGGIREIEVCGSLRMIGTQTGIQYEKTNYKSETVLRTGYVMGTCNDIQEAVDGSQSIQDIQEAIEEIEETTDKNEYPVPPTIAVEPNILCSTSWYIARELDSIIQQLILGTDFQNIQEFIAYWLFDGGWKYTSLAEIWNLFNTLNNPSLSSEITSAIEHVAHAFYCNELDRALATAQIQADSNISTDAKALYVAVIEAWTNSKFALATAIGRDQASEDCSTFCPSENWLRLGGDGNANMEIITGFVYGDAVYNAIDDRYESPATGEVNNSYTQIDVRWNFGEAVTGSIQITIRANRTRSYGGTGMWVYTDAGLLYSAPLADDTSQSFTLGLTSATYVQIQSLAPSVTPADGRYIWLSKIDITPS